MDDVRGHSMFRRYRKPSSSSRSKAQKLAKAGFRKYHNPSSSSPAPPNRRPGDWFRKYCKSSSSSLRGEHVQKHDLFRSYRNPSNSSPSRTPALISSSLGSTVNQAVVHQPEIEFGESLRFEDIVDQAVAHPA